MASRYENSTLSRDRKGKRFFTNPIYPEIPVTENDIYVITTGTDRYDKLALQFYNDSTLWWIIASSNNGERAGLIPTPGLQLRIPASKSQALKLYREINKSR